MASAKQLANQRRFAAMAKAGKGKVGANAKSATKKSKKK